MSTPKVTYGIRVRRHRRGPRMPWTRGRQFRRASRGRWVFWRKAWPTKEAAELRLDQLRAQGWFGHVFEIQPKPVFPNSTHYSANFTREELNCKGRSVPGDCGCNGRNPSPEIQRELEITARTICEPLRAERGQPIAILSGYRCPKHNAYVGGASQSMHMSGKAVDPHVPYGQQDAYYADMLRVEAVREGGAGKYANGGLHGDRGSKRRW